MSGLKKRVAVLAAAVALALGCLLAMPAYAYAQVQVSGADYLTTQGSAAGDGYVDVLSVQGDEGDRIYVNVEHDGQTIASHLPYELTADSASTASDGKLAGVMSLQVSEFQAGDAYTVTVYADYDETQQLYRGALTGVFARLGDAGATELLGVRTVGDEQRAFNAPARYESGGITYELASADPVSTSPLTYAYAEAPDTPDAVDGSITYVDDEGNVLAADTIAGLRKGAAAQEVAIPHAVKNVVKGADGRDVPSWWMPVNFSHKVYASYPGTTDFVVPCKRLDLTETDVNGSAFVAKITYLAGDQALLTDEVPVSKLYYYAPPETLTLGSGATARSYGLSEAQDARFERTEGAEEGSVAGRLRLDPKAENPSGEDNPTVEININYDARPDMQTYYVRLWLCSTSSDHAQPTSLGEKSYQVKDGDAPESFDPANNEFVDSSQYDLAPGMRTEPYTFSYGSDLPTVTNVYYVPKGEKPAAEPYEITIQYRDAADRSLIESHTYTVSPDGLEDKVYASPESFTSGSTTYVRLKGQEAGIQHGYYTMYRTYTVWYRDVNNSLLADVVVNPLTYTVVDNGTTRTVAPGTNAGDGDTGGAGAAAGATDDGTTVTLGDGAGQNVLTDANGEGGAALNGEGQDANAERIGDNETPLASGAPAEGASTGSPLSNPAVIAGVVAAGALALLLVLLLLRRRKAHDDGGQAEQ